MEAQAQCQKEAEWRESDDIEGIVQLERRRELNTSTWSAEHRSLQRSEDRWQNKVVPQAGYIGHDVPATLVKSIPGQSFRAMKERGTICASVIADHGWCQISIEDRERQDVAFPLCVAGWRIPEKEEAKGVVRGVQLRGGIAQVEATVGEYGCSAGSEADRQMYNLSWDKDVVHPNLPVGPFGLLPGTTETQDQSRLPGPDDNHRLSLLRRKGKDESQVAAVEALRAQGDVDGEFSPLRKLMRGWEGSAAVYAPHPLESQRGIPRHWSNPVEGMKFEWPEADRHHGEHKAGDCQGADESLPDGAGKVHDEIKYTSPMRTITMIKRCLAGASRMIVEFSDF